MNISALSNSIQEGKTIAYPTETVWGIGCDPSNDIAVRKIYRIKKRDPAKASLLIVDSLNTILKYAKLNDLEKKLLLSNEPTTVIIDNIDSFSELLKGPNKSIGFRICSFGPISETIKQCGHPIVSTSANFSGNPAATIQEELDPKLLELVDCCADFDNPNPAKKSSRIVKIQTDNIVVIRP